jgi:hypothetical protein
LVLKKPFKYAVAGYGVFNCVNGGVISKTGADKIIVLTKIRKSLLVLL